MSIDFSINTLRGENVWNRITKVFGLTAVMLLAVLVAGCKANTSTGTSTVEVKVEPTTLSLTEGESKTLALAATVSPELTFRPVFNLTY